MLKKLNWAAGQSLTPIGLERVFQRSTQAADSLQAAKMSKLPPRVPWRIKQSVATLAQVGIQAPGLSFPCICHLGNPIKTRFESGFCLLCSSHGPCCLSPYHQVCEIWLYWILSALCGGIWYTAGKKPATCRTCGRTFPRPNVTLSDFLPAKSERKKGNRSRNSSPGMSRRSRNVSPSMSSSVVSWSDSPREHSAANGEETVMEDGTETHQAEINKKIKANDKLRKTLTNMPEEHRTFICGDSFKSKMESLDDEKAAFLAAKRQFLPLQSLIDRQKTIWSEFREKSNQNKRSVWKSCKNGLRPIRKRKQQKLNRCKPNKSWRCWWLNSLRKMQKLSTKGIQGFSLTCQDTSLIKLHNTQFSQCSNPFSRCKASREHGVSEQLTAAGATEEDVQKISQVMAQTVRTLETGIANPEPGPEAHSLPCEVVRSDEELSNGICVPGFSKMDTEGQEAIKRSLSNAIKRVDWRRNANRKVKVCSEYFTSLAQEVWDTDQVLFARGLLLRDWLLACELAECSEVRMWESSGFQEYASDNVLIASDGSGGSRETPKSVRQVAFGVATFSLQPLSDTSSKLLRTGFLGGQVPGRQSVHPNPQSD